MSEWGPQNFPTSLVQLYLKGENSGVVSFAVADDVSKTTAPSSSFLLPPSLVSLVLDGFMDVESFSEVLQHLPCLKTLHIRRKGESAMGVICVEDASDIIVHQMVVVELEGHSIVETTKDKIKYQIHFQNLG
ncbi:hypothetical protein L1887_18107 [Cichorium endivia]|nr:hypothetical protein L1887_18107 [Cichorium endivia]